MGALGIQENFFIKHQRMPLKKKKKGNRQISHCSKKILVPNK